MCHINATHTVGIRTHTSGAIVNAPNKFNVFFACLFDFRPRRKLHISIEALFMIDFPTLKHKLSFFLDRMNQRVTLDVTANGATVSKHFELPNTNETSTIRSLALHFHKNRIAMLVDCKESSTHELDVSLTELYAQMDTDPVIKLVGIQFKGERQRTSKRNTIFNINLFAIFYLIVQGTQISIVL